MTFPELMSRYPELRSDAPGEKVCAMTSAHQPMTVEDEDGSFNVWITGWHICYPLDGGRPTVKSGQARQDSAPSTSVKVHVDDGVISLRYANWIIRLQEGVLPRVTPAVAGREPVGGVYLNRRRDR
jgi:hypothetical protein